ncbi:MAG: class I SAM-dependent methyltransferase [Sumerlaeia bacterium]
MTEEKFSDVYDERYKSETYRTSLTGYECSRYEALKHIIPVWCSQGDIGTMLDYGAGRGLYVPLWKELFPKANLVACDVSEIALGQLSKDHANCKTVHMEDGVLPPHFHNQFDLVVSVEVLEHVEDLELYLTDVFSALKPGGRFIWTTPCANAFSIEHVYSAIRRQIVLSETGERRWKWEDPTHLRRLTTKEATKAANTVGFVDVDFRFRSHLFSFIFSKILTGKFFQPMGVPMMNLDYTLFRRLPNGASMIGFACKPK